MRERFSSPNNSKDSAMSAARREIKEIREGTFAAEWIDGCRSGGKLFRHLHDADVGTPLERAGEAVRSLMPWLSGR